MNIKQTFCVLAGCFFLLGTAHASPYGVQIAAHAKPELANIGAAKTVGEIKQLAKPNGITVFIVGDYATLEAASQALMALRELGYADSYIVPLPRKDTATEPQTIPTLHEGKGELVMLDGTPHMKVGDEFFRLDTE